MRAPRPRCCEELYGQLTQGPRGRPRRDRCGAAHASRRPIRRRTGRWSCRSDRAASSSSPRSPNQAAYLRALDQHDLVFALGPAGTGKTYLAVAMAVALLRQRRGRAASSCPARRSRPASGWAFCPAISRTRSTPTCARSTTRSRTCCPRASCSGASRQRPDRDRTARLHARPHPGQRLRHPRRGAEHHALADEDVPDPPGRKLAHGGHRRPDADATCRRACPRAWPTPWPAGRRQGIGVVRFDQRTWFAIRWSTAIIDAYERRRGRRPVTEEPHAAPNGSWPLRYGQRQ